MFCLLGWLCKKQLLKWLSQNLVERRSAWTQADDRRSSKHDCRSSALDLPEHRRWTVQVGVRIRASVWVRVRGFGLWPVLLSGLFLGLEIKTETLAIRSQDQDRDLGLQISRLGLQVSRPRPRPGSSGLETETWTKWTRVHSQQLWLHQFQLVTEHCLKGATNYGNCVTGVGTKHAVLRPRLRPGSSGLETKTETLAIRSRDRDRDLDKMNSSALESRDHSLEITTLFRSRVRVQWSVVICGVQTDQADDLQWYVVFSRPVDRWAKEETIRFWW